MVYRIDVFNRQNELIKYRMTSDMMNSRLIGCTWQMQRIGGCGNASIDIETTDYNFDLIGARDLVKIFYGDETDPRYTGFVIKRPKPYAVEKLGNYELAGLINQINDYPIVRT